MINAMCCLQHCIIEIGIFAHKNSKKQMTFAMLMAQHGKQAAETQYKTKQFAPELACNPNCLEVMFLLLLKIHCSINIQVGNIRTTRKWHHLCSNINSIIHKANGLTVPGCSIIWLSTAFWELLVTKELVVLWIALNAPQEVLLSEKKCTRCS